MFTPSLLGRGQFADYSKLGTLAKNYLFHAFINYQITVLTEKPTYKYKLNLEKERFFSL